MTAPFENTETLDEAVAEHINLVDKVEKLAADVVLLRSAAAQNSADVLRAIDAATTAVAKGDLILKRLDALRGEIRRAVGSNGLSHG